jgi:hypothetical protein
VGNAEDRNRSIDEREGAAEDVEGHGFPDSPSAEQPSAERTDEGDDVEAHSLLTDSPSAESPSAE